MNLKLIYGLAVCAIFALGYGSATYKAKLDFTEYQLEVQKKIAELNRSNTERVRAIEFENQDNLNKQKESYEKTIADLRRNFKPSGVLKCPKLPTAGTNSPELICYTKAELQRKIEGTLAIAREADELAVKYNSLLKIHEVNQ